jgi:hypothetical protein
MTALRLMLALLFVGLAGPALAGERVQWIDPWADDELAGGSEAGSDAAVDGRIDITGEVESFGFSGGVERPFAFVPASAPFAFRRFPAGQVAVTGDSVRMFRPRPRF